MQLDVVQYAKQGRSVRKTILASEISKLEGLIRANDDALEVHLNFCIGDQGMPFAKGSVKGALELICQRCMQPMPFPLSAEVDLVLIDAQMVDSAKSRFDLNHFIYECPQVSLSELVSDDIILNLPLVARHLKQCPIEFNVREQDEGTQETRTASESDRMQPKTSPFSVLKTLVDMDAKP